MNTDPLPFTLEWLAEAARTSKPLTVCADGHLVVSKRSHWAPAKFSADLHALWCEPVECDRGPDT
jgi:hypothetical protein